LQSNWGISSAG